MCTVVSLSLSVDLFVMVALFPVGMCVTTTQ